jgi:3'-5' exonuclease
MTIAKMPLENFLVIDIETVSAQPAFEALSEQWQQLWMEKVQRMLPENETAATFYEQRAGVMAEFSKIVCICLGYFKKENQALQFRVKTIAHHNETELLQQFVDTVDQLEAVHQRWSFTGHNIKEFDVPFICRRLLINGLAIPPYLDFQNMKPWETNLIDTFQYWRFGDYKNFTSLNLLAACLDVPSPKEDIDGSKVGQVYWQEKDLQRIATYCGKDVATVANIILKFKNLPLLQPEQVVYV